MASKLELRAQALEKTLEVWKDRSFRMPKRDCLKMVLFGLKQMGVKLPKADKLIGYRTPLQARATLKRVYGVQTVPDLLDKYFERITVAACLPADIISAPGAEEGTLGAIGLYYGNNLMICYEEEHDKPVIGRLEPEDDNMWDKMLAWRSLP